MRYLHQDTKCDIAVESDLNSIYLHLIFAILQFEICIQFDELNELNELNMQSLKVRGPFGSLDLCKIYYFHLYFAVVSQAVDIYMHVIGKNNVILG